MRILLIAFLAIILASTGSQEQPARPDYVLVIHGGAGTIRRDLMSSEAETAYREGLAMSLDAGISVLDSGGSALDAVEAAIRILEDNPLFNAGIGAVLTHEGTVEMDASIMDGATLAAGAVCGIKTIRNPIRAARLVLDVSPHVMLCGSGADAFARENGLPSQPNEWFRTDRRIQSLQKQLEAEQSPSEDKSPEPEKEPVLKKYGTVGAVALDRNGNLAAGTSTGGMSNKRYGRVGDSPVIGAGTYADNRSCAVSCTGHGEFYIRNVIAYNVAAQMEYGGKSLAEACQQVIHGKLTSQGGTGGLIALDKEGNFQMPFNTSGMFRAFATADGNRDILIYEE